MNSNDLEKNTREIMMSKTFARLVDLSSSIPMQTEEEMKIAFSTCLMEMVRALDNDRIHFDEINDKAIFHGLLTTALTYTFDGKVPAQKIVHQ